MLTKVPGLTGVPPILFCRLRLYHGTPRALLHPLLQDPIERKKRRPAVLGATRTPCTLPELCPHTPALWSFSVFITSSAHLTDLAKCILGLGFWHNLRD